MRVVVDAYHALFPSGGVARYTRGLVTELAKLLAAEEITLFYNRFRESGKAWKPTAGNPRIRQIHLPRRMLGSMWNTWEWPPIEMLCGSVDLFHGLHFVLPPARRARRVLTVHDLTYLKVPHYFNDRGLNEYGYRWELPRALARADVVIATSCRTRDDLLELMKVSADRVHVVYEGVDHQQFAEVDGERGEIIRKLYGLSAPYLVFLVGTPEPRKNLPRTVAAVRQGAPDMPLIVIGPEAPLRSLLGGNLHDIVFTGVVPDNHLPGLLSGACMSLYPSLYEGFGLPVLEAMACGVPVITSDRGSLPEISGGAAILVNPEDVEEMAAAISRLLADGALCQRLKTEGKKRAAAFSWDKAAAETLMLYRQII